MDLTRIVLLYLCIAIGCLFWQPNIVLGSSPQANTVLSLFNIDSSNYLTLNNLNHSTSGGSQFDNVIKQGNPSSPVTIILTIIDGLFNVMGYLILFTRMIFAPVFILTSGGMPIELVYVFGIPAVVLFIVAIVRLIRGY